MRPDPDDAVLDWLASNFGPARIRRFAQDYILEGRFSVWDFFFGLFLMAGALGPRHFAVLPVIAVWLFVRVWAELKARP